MRARSNAVLVILAVTIASILDGEGVHAQTVRGSTSIALKSGESVEVGNVYYTINCRSLLKSVPQVEILEGAAGGDRQHQGGHGPSSWRKLRKPSAGRHIGDHSERNRRPQLHPPYNSSHL